MAGAAADDDPSISDDALFWRRVHPDHIVLDENLGRQRPSSQEFRDDELSVILAEPGRQPATALEAHPGRFLVAIGAHELRQRGLAITRDPTDDEPAHCVVLGKKTRSTAEGLARAAVWVVPPPE